MKIFFASGNEHKLEEVREIFSGHDILSMTADIIEDGITFAENALKKAEYVMGKTGCVTLADDSGLEIKHLDGAPGIYSARFLGDTTFEQKCEKILEMMEGVEDREAKFTTAIALIFPDPRRNNIVRTAHLFGEISREKIGENGFGYDPIFFVPEYNMTVAQMKSELKNKISHRRKALDMVRNYLEQ